MYRFCPVRETSCLHDSSPAVPGQRGGSAGGLGADAEAGGARTGQSCGGESSETRSVARRRRTVWRHSEPQIPQGSAPALQ